MLARLIHSDDRLRWAGAFDEAVTTGLQRSRPTMEVLTDLPWAEEAHRQAASIR